MQRPVVAVLYVLTMIAVIVGVDVLFLRSRFWMRLIANVGIVLVFAAVYFAFLKRTR
jgi:Mg2+/citrate symporter